MCSIAVFFLPTPPTLLHPLPLTTRAARPQLKLLSAEGRVEALEGQVSHLESIRRDMEHKLTSMYSSLRRVAGIRLDGGSGGQWRPPSPAVRRPGMSARG